MMQNPQARMRTASPLSMQQANHSHANLMGRGRGLPIGGGGLRGADPYSAAAPRTVGPPPSQSQYSPPMSQHASGSTDNSLSSRTNRSVSASASHLSSASSVSRQSDGVGGFYSPTVSEFGRAPPSAGRDGSSGPGGPPAPGGGGGGIQPATEETLSRHYVVLKRYLTPYLQAEAGNNRTTKARDKLLRLSSTQFHELSTDVFDELLRREEDRKRPGGGVPPSLPPKNTFHPKRNQARKKLSTLPPDRFRQLATDVYYELERRIPRIAAGVAAGEYDRVGSPTGSISSNISYRTSSRGGMGGPVNGLRGGPPPPGMRINGQYPPRHGSLSQPYSPHDEMHPPPRLDSRARSNTVDMSRPIPQTFQSNTIVPNKSTMVEDDETDEEDDEGASGLERVLTGKRSTADSGLMKEYESQIANLQERIHELEKEIESVQSSHGQHSADKEVWEREKSDLDSRLLASQQSLENLHQELEQAHTERSQNESDLRAETERTVSDLQLELEELRRENEHLRLRDQQHEQEHQQLSRQNSRSDEDHASLQAELKQQRALTEQVRNDSLRFLAEMRELSSQSDLAAEREEALRSQVANLEQETEHWRLRYTKARTQVRSLKATSVGLGIQHESEAMLCSRHSPHNSMSQETRLVRRDGSGLIKDTDVTSYQLSIDAVIYAARDADTELALEKAKAVIKAVRAIVADIDGDHFLNSTANSPTHSSTRNSQLNGSVSGSVPGSTTHPVALKARITRDANRLVTAARTHAISHGISPISLLDAAASNLTASIVALLLIVGIKPSPDHDLKHESTDFDDRYDHEEDVQPLQLQPRSFGDDTPPVPSHHFDEAMESPVIRSGFVGRENTLSPPPHEPLPLNTSGRGSSADNRDDKENHDGNGNATTAGNGMLGSGWFNMLKSPASSHKGSMIESDGDSDDERYGYA